jgi:hypothetical protein
VTTTVQEVFEITMDLIDERLDSGVIDATDTASYKAKTPGILNVLQSELLKPGDLFSTHSISNKPIENQLGYRSEFNIINYEGTEQTYSADSIARAYYFEVDDSATVYVEDYTSSWNILATISAISTSGFTAYKGVVTPTAGATKSRLRFTGSYYYRHVNRALFNVPFASSSKVPDYRPWIKKTMPSDFKGVDEIINEFYETNYIKDANYKWEGRNTLYIDYYYDGNIRILYHPVPIKLTATTDNLQLDDVTCRTILPYGLAAHLLLTENTESASFFQQRFEELKVLGTRQQAASAEQIADIYGGI